jgi:hypothetical protein
MVGEVIDSSLCFWQRESNFLVNTNLLREALCTPVLDVMTLPMKFCGIVN